MFRRLQTSVLLALAVLALAGCGADRTTETVLSSSEVMPDLTGADPRLAKLADQADDLLGGGRPAFEERLKSLRGLPVVANKWASWCTPCKAEAPILQRGAREYGNRIAFLGINAFDDIDGSEQFRQKFPMPYPSYEDPKFKISALLPPADKQPVTGFWDSDGKLIGQKYGEYLSLAELEADIDRHFGKLTLDRPAEAP